MDKKEGPVLSSAFCEKTGLFMQGEGLATGLEWKGAETESMLGAASALLLEAY